MVSSKLASSQEQLLTRIKDEIGNLDEEILVLQRNLTKAIRILKTMQDREEKKIGAML